MLGISDRAMRRRRPAVGPRFPRAPLLLAGLVALLAVGCAANNNTRGEEMDTPPMTDQAVVDAVETEMMFDPAIPHNEVDVSCIDGTVTLKGTVGNLLAKRRAVRLAETVRGVKSVIDRTDVQPSITRRDYNIESDARTALLHDRATESWEIGVDVENGIATLNGTVDSWQEKQLAEKVVAGVRGVRGIDNRIDIVYDTERTDGEIAAEVRRALRYDVLVDHGLVDVAVEDGRVKLTGTVGSAAEKRRARIDAWVAGVDAVANELEVERWAQDEQRRDQTVVIKSESELEDAVEQALVFDPRVNSLNVAVDADAGAVTLRGTVDSLAARRAAEHDARHTVGVLRVRNLIKVRASTPGDAEIEKRLEAALKRDPYIERYELAIEVIDGEAYLTGTVDTHFEKSRADELASRIYGIEEISNDLEVEDPRYPIVSDPFLDGHDAYIYQWYDYEPYYTWKSDQDIEQDIQRQLFWNPFVRSADVDVAVDDSVATLSGNVASKFEKNQAAEEAFEAGATWVYNQIEVR